MKRKRIWTWTIATVLVTVVLSSTGCKTQQVASVKKRTVKLSHNGEEEQNFNYLFTEALKQKTKGNIQMSLKFLKACHEIKPNDDAVNYELSRLLAYTGEMNQAKRYAWMALDKDPKNIWYHYQLANIYKAENNVDTLTMIYEQMVQTFPSRDDLKYQLAKIYSANRKFKKALEVYGQLMGKYGYSKDLGLNREAVFEEWGKYKEAMEEVNRLIVLDSSDVRIWGLKADILSKKGEFSKAEELLNKLIEKYPEDERLKISMVEHAIRKGDESMIIESLKSFLNCSGLEPQSVYQFIMGVMNALNEKEGIRSQVVEYFVHWLIEGNRDFSLIANFADYLISQNNTKAVIPLLKQITKIKPDILAAWQQLGFAEQAEEKVDSLVSDMQKGLEVFPEEPLLSLLYASGLRQQERYEEAAVILEKTIKGLNKNENKALLVQSYGMLGDIYHYLGKYEKSDKYYEMALKNDPENTVVLNNYSYFLSIRGTRLEEARKMSKKTIEKEPDNPTYLDTYGWILYKLGDYKTAEKFIRKAVEMDTNVSAEVLEHLGDVLYSNGKIKEAIKYWSEALRKEQSREGVQKKIDNARKGR